MHASEDSSSGLLTMPRLADTPNAEVEAAKFSVPPQIHAEDFLYQWHLEQNAEPDRDKARRLVTEYYFADGARSAAWLDDLIRKHHPAAGSRRLSLFEFASGYGCVSRHLRKMDDRYDLVACDIHPQAIDFLRQQLGVNAVLSCADPRGFDAKGKSDIVFALSFFSHMPDRTFGAWITALLEVLADDGLLIFTTHGRLLYELGNRPPLEPAGYVFYAGAEQKDLPSDDYGTTIATPFYVMEQIAQYPGAAVVAYQEEYWWGIQDVFVVRKVPGDFRPSRAAAQAPPVVAQDQVDAANAMELPPSGLKPDHYLRIYEQLFEPIRTRPIAFLELGVLTGGSLKCWESYFPAGRIAGIDLNVPAAEFGERVRVYAGSQNDLQLLSRVAAEVAPDGFDVIIDDCAHIGALAKASFWHLFENHLKPGGLYCVEDWGTGYWPTWPDGRELVVEPDSERRMPSHDAGMVGFIKQLIDEVHIDAVRGDFSNLHRGNRSLPA